MSLIKSPDHREYLILNTLKEIIQDSKDISKSLIDLVPFLFDYAENKDESLKNFVAECVGSHYITNKILINFQFLKKKARFVS